MKRASVEDLGRAFVGKPGLMAGSGMHHSILANIPAPPPPLFK